MARSRASSQRQVVSVQFPPEHRRDCRSAGSRPQRRRKLGQSPRAEERLLSPGLSAAWTLRGGLFEPLMMLSQNRDIQSRDVLHQRWFLIRIICMIKYAICS